MDNKDTKNTKEKEKEAEDESQGEEGPEVTHPKNRQRNTDARRRLQELEENVVAKSRSDSDRATVPGAFASVGGRRSAKGSSSSSSQVEQDARTKRRLRRGRSQPEAEGALTQLESDVLAKRSAGSTGATVPGAVASTSGSRFPKAASDSRIGTGSRSSDTRAKLRDLESQTLAKSRARAERSSGTAVDPVSRKLAANSGGGGSAAFSSMRALERDVLSKSIMRTRSAPRPGSRFTLDAVSEEDAHSSDHELDSDSEESYHDEPDIEHQDDSGASNDLVPPIYSASSMESGFSNSSLGRAHTSRVSPVDPPDSDVGSDTNNALDAFIAETVVDATGVAIVMSDEDRKKLIKQLNRRYLCYGCILFIIITIAIVVPLVVILGGSSSEEPEEVAPTVNVSRAPSPSPSQEPTTFGIGESIDFLTSNSISKLEALQDRDSPQYLAMEWVTDNDPLGLDFNDPQQRDQWLQRYLLVVLYFAMDGDNWVECSRGSAGCATSGSSWLTGDHECEWLAVLCDESLGVTGIAFLRSNGNNLVGELPDEFFLMTDLRAIVLQNNKLQGSMSESWGQLSNLMQLVLAGNELTGFLPDFFFQKAEKLGRLMLGGNMFEGELPISLSQLPLTQLRLEENIINGTIPDALFDMTTIQDLRLAGNSLAGPLSNRFGELTALTSLELQRNDFTGPVPSGFETLVALDRLFLHGNLLTGSVSNGTCSLMLRELTVDCSEVECTCCTRCF